MENRVFGIIDEAIEGGNIEGLISRITSSKVTSSIVVFTSSDKKFTSSDSQCQVFTVSIPQEKKTRPMKKNFALRWMKDNIKVGKAHLLEDRIEFCSQDSDICLFVRQIENTMDALDLHNYLGTITDGCNYVYTKYNPRLSVVLDDQKYQKLGLGSSVVFCSHSNVQWIIVDLEKADDNEMYFDESFEIDMYWIIEFLARRRNSHPDSLYFMNQYYTCPAEYKVYKFKENVKGSQIENVEDKMRSEDSIFKQKCLSYAPDNNVDVVLERLYNKLNSKISKGV